MKQEKNPMRVGHRASSSSPAYLAGASSNPDSTIIRVGSRVVGKVQHGIFLKKVKASRHFLRHPEAIAFDVGSLRQAQQAGARTVKVIDAESGKVYKAFLSTIWAKGFELDRGYGKQIALPLSEWSLGNEPFGEQVKLWGEK